MWMRAMGMWRSKCGGRERICPNLQPLLSALARQSSFLQKVSSHKLKYCFWQIRIIELTNSIICHLPAFCLSVYFIYSRYWLCGHQSQPWLCSRRQHADVQGNHPGWPGTARAGGDWELWAGLTHASEWHPGRTWKSYSLHKWLSVWLWVTLYCWEFS